MKRKNIFLLIIALVTIGLAPQALKVFNNSLGLAAISSAGKKSRIPCTLTPPAREFNHTSYYTGPLIDAHVHMPAASKIVGLVAKSFGEKIPVIGDSLTIDSIACLFKSENITKSFGFYLIPKYAEGQSVSVVKKAKRESAEEIIPFLMPPPMPVLTISPKAVENILKKSPGLFKGYGEIALDRDTSGDNAVPDKPELLEIYKLAEKYNLVVMIHPRRNQAEPMKKIFAEFPKVNFLVHGGNEGWVVDAMPSYNNVYYSVDNTSHIFGWSPMHRFNPPTKEEYLENLRENFDSMLDEAVSRYKYKIESYPSRFLWGTDRGMTAWSFDPEVSGLLVEFDRAFIGRLDPSVQEKFAYQNTERLLQSTITEP